MYLIEIFLPRFDNDAQPFPSEALDTVREELANQFGGVTAFMRSPAVGIWQDDAGSLWRDEIVIFEVMAKDLDRQWWKLYRQQLEQRFRQKEVVVRALTFDPL